MGIQYYNDRICLNILAGDLQNAKDCYTAMEGKAVIGVLSSSYTSVEAAVTDMMRYYEALDGNVSIGLGGGNPMQWKAVAEIASIVPANHINQVFSAVGYTRACAVNQSAHINALITPTGIPGQVKISTGALSRLSADAIIPIETAIAMIEEMGGNAVKFFPLQGLSFKADLKAAARACAAHNMVLEPTGGIDLQNFEEILQMILAEGVQKVIPHVYSSIIDKTTGLTSVSDVETLSAIIKRITAD